MIVFNYTQYFENLIVNFSPKRCIVYLELLLILTKLTVAGHEKEKSISRTDAYKIRRKNIWEN